MDELPESDKLDAPKEAGADGRKGCFGSNMPDADPLGGRADGLDTVAKEMRDDDDDDGGDDGGRDTDVFAFVFALGAEGLRLIASADS